MADMTPEEREKRIAEAKAKPAAAKAAREQAAAAGSEPPKVDAGAAPSAVADDDKAKRIAEARAKAAAAKAAREGGPGAAKKEEPWPHPAMHREPKDTRELDLIKKGFGAAVKAVGDASGKPVLYVDPLRAFDIIRYAKEELGFNHLPFVSACDYIDQGIFEVHWQLYAYPAGEERGRDLIVKAHIPRDDPVVPSVTGLYTGADWHEREAYDLFGIRFEGHPELKRIFMPEGWRGHPLRKDYDRTPQYIGLGEDGEDVVFDTPGPGRW
jgi:NADH-quinone oxidoreductase subunit C